MNDIEFKIEKGLPISGRLLLHLPWVEYPFEDMEVGDSFLLPTRDTSIFSAESDLLKIATRWSMQEDNGNDWRFETRVTREGVRIWRIK